MEEFVEIAVDEHNVYLRRNIPLLQALKERNIILPSMCYSSKLEPYGSCGLCILEVYMQGAWKVQRACLLQAEKELLIRTGSTRISKLRARAARLLLKRGPFLKQEAEKLLVSLIHQSEESDEPDLTNKCLVGHEERPQKKINQGCILCGLCVAICRKIGRHQLVFLGKGKNLRVGLIEGSQADSCGLCQACRHICPTGFIGHDPRQVFTARLYK